MLLWKRQEEVGVDLSNATTDEVAQVTWMNREQMKELYVFVAANPFFAEKFESQLNASECSKRLLVHEYGHTIQSLILGPLYLFVIGIPSTLWGFFGAKKRKKEQVAYGAFFTEGWANRLGEWVTGERSIGDMVLE